MKRLVCQLVFFFFEKSFKLLGRKRAYYLARSNLINSWTSKVSRILLTKKNHYLEANLLRIFPNISQDQLTTYKNQFYKNMLTTAIESITMDGKDIQRTKLKGLDNLQKAIQNKHHILFVTGHFNNWEIALTNIEALGYPLQVLIRDFSESTCDIYSANRKHRTNVKALVSTKNVKQFIHELQKGTHACILPDLKVKNQSNAVRLNFAGHPAWTSTFAARMAIRYRMMVIPTFIYRTYDNEFVQHFLEPLYVPDNISHKLNDPSLLTQKAIDLTQKINDSLSRELLKDPGSWILWDTNRWGP